MSKGLFKKPGRAPAEATSELPGSIPTSDPGVADGFRSVLHSGSTAPEQGEDGPEAIMPPSRAGSVSAPDLPPATTGPVKASQAGLTSADTITRINLNMKVAALSLAEMASVARQVGVELERLIDAITKAGAMPAASAETLKDQAKG